MRKGSTQTDRHPLREDDVSRHREKTATDKPGRAARDGPFFRAIAVLTPGF